MPRKITGLETPKEEFASQRAMQHVEALSKKPHYTGSEGHSEVQEYLKNELIKLGLTPETQTGFSISQYGALSQPHNIFARIKGSRKEGKALLLLSHYDSCPHSSYGASDAGSGVATILEGIRAFLSTQKPKNDIIVCFTDSEELNLIGAKLFVNEHPWVKDIGLVLNFEARGSGGNSYMLLETNSKNGKLVKEFIEANPQYPFTNSLAYSIYKLLPNDTDLTIFRRDADIPGYNFAFIDDYFDYHTANDIAENLDLNSLEHQGSYLMPLLSYFSSANLSDFASDEDFIYFNTAIFKMVTYPFDWIYPMLGIAILLFIGLIIYGVKEKKLYVKSMGKGILIFLSLMITSCTIGFLIYKAIFVLYKSNQEILHGFTYNGHLYIYATILISIGVFFKAYKFFQIKETAANLLIAPIFIWIIICSLTAIYLPGASYFIIPVFFALVCLMVVINQKTPPPSTLLILCLPPIFIISPFITELPVALGLRLLFASGLLSILIAGLMLPVFTFYKRLHWMGNGALVIGCVFIIIAHFQSNFTEERPKPNSLVYFLDYEQQKAYWGTYDITLDSWNQHFFDQKENDTEFISELEIASKYNTAFSKLVKAPLKKIEASSVEVSFDSIIGVTRHLDICINPKRKLHRIDFYVNQDFPFQKITANGTTTRDFIHPLDKKTYNTFTNRWSDRFLTYILNHNKPLELRMQFHKDSIPKLTMLESSFDLLENTVFSVPQRPKDMIAKPFVINDAIMVRQKIEIQPYQKQKVNSNKLPRGKTVEALETRSLHY